MKYTPFAHESKDLKDLLAKSGRQNFHVQVSLMNFHASLLLKHQTMGKVVKYHNQVVFEKKRVRCAKFALTSW
jgi:hypothetical protein